MHLSIILAAGQSRRFGPQNKLLAPLGGRPLVAHAAQSVLGAKADARYALIADEAVAAALPDGIAVYRVRAEQSFAERLHVAAQLAHDLGAQWLSITLGDMPYIRAAHLEDLRRQCPIGGIARTVSAGYTGVPVCLHQKLFPRLAALPAGDAGLRGLGRGDWPCVDIVVAATSVHDIDRPSDLAAQ